MKKALDRTGLKNVEADSASESLKGQVKKMNGDGGGDGVITKNDLFEIAIYSFLFIVFLTWLSRNI